MSLHFIRGPGGLYRAYDLGTGLAFTVERFESVGPRGGRQVEYQIRVGATTESPRYWIEAGFKRFGEAAARCQEIVAEAARSLWRAETERIAARFRERTDR